MLRLGSLLVPLAAAILLTACTTLSYQRNVPPCPPPPAPPPCAPGYTNTVVYDTSRMIGSVRWSIRRVLGASSATHEWGLLKHADVNLLVSGGTPARASYTTVKIDRHDVVTTTSQSSANPVFITNVAPAAVMGDASVVPAFVTNGVAVADLSRWFPVNTGLYWDGHPTLSPSGKILVFASDRPGGEGGTDLWYSVRKENGWTTPSLVKGVVNTPCDELCPQFAADSVLLFSSAGHSTVGGYDLFSATIIQADSVVELGEPRNMGPPVNTPFDELFPSWHSSNTLYYGSDQPSRGSTTRKDFDVFVLTSVRLTTDEPTMDIVDNAPDLELPTQNDAPLVTVTGTVIREDTKEPVPNADVTATSATENVVIAKTTTDTSGNYELNVPPNKPIDIQAQTPELFFDKVRITVPSTNTHVELRPGRSADTVRIEKPLSLPTTFVLRVNFPTAIFDKPYPNVLDSNGLETSTTWQQALDDLAANIKASGNRLRRIVLIGHTDDVDTDANNLVLGKNRVDFIINQLVSRGAPREILEGRSAGETLLPARRKGESIILWRKRARRVELVKVMQE